MRAVSIIGRKNSGKTTLLVAIAAELKRRRVRVVSLKHCHHGFDLDREGSDSWRHYNEGAVDAVLLAAPDKLAVISRRPPGLDTPEDLIQEVLARFPADLALVEAFTDAALPKLEIFRGSVHARPIYLGATPMERAHWLGVVTDAPDLLAAAPCPVIPLDAEGSHIAAGADLIQAFMSEQPQTA